ncbi:MAG TPA: hypothetical protein VFS43_16215 [Polyangiaceae bacterium]|nr:hypothetical protein [Polyangiaceae bacterium]
MAPSLLPPPVLEGLDEGLLGRLLAPYGAFLARRGADPTSPGWRARLAAALRRDDPDLPAALRHLLDDLVALATPEGEAELRALAAEAGVALGAPPGRAADAAAEAYLDRRALFRAAYARLSSLTMGRFVDYCAGPDRAARPLSPAGRAALRHGGPGDGGAGEGAPAVSVADGAEELVVVFEPARPAGAPGQRGEPVVAVFAKAGRTLSLNPPDPGAQERLRALFGRVLFGDEAAFAPCRCLTSAPFGDRGPGALGAAGIDGLGAVRLRKLVVRTPEASHLTLSAEADDLAGALGPEGRVGAMLRLGEVAHWTLEFFPVGRPPFLVELDPPNRWRLADRRDAPLVRRFLARRGFLAAGA